MRKPLASGESIRPVRRSDLEAVARLCGELGYPPDPPDPPDPLDPGHGALARRLDTLLREPRHAVLVAEREGQGVIGLVHVYTDTWLVLAATADIGGLVVSEAHRGSGVGARLLAAAEAWAAAHGCRRLFVRTNAIRERAHRFYERQGYDLLKSQRVYQRRLPPAARSGQRSS